MLAQDGLGESQTLDAGAATRVWKVFAAFAALPVEGMSPQDDSDGVLFQSGVYDWGDGRHFNFSLVRQYIFDGEAGEYDHMEQLECLLLYDPTPALESLPVEEVWSFGMTIDEWIATVEQLTSFRAVVTTPLAPVELQLRLDEV